jgi:hypothetical protein
MTVPSIGFIQSTFVPREYRRRFRKYWKENSAKLLRNIETYTGIPWKGKRVRVHMKPQSRLGILGWIEQSKPYDVILHMASDSRVNISTIAHELVHSNVWSSY